MKVLFCMEEAAFQTLPGVAELLGELTEKGIPWKQYPVGKAKEKGEEFGLDGNTLIITDSVFFVRYLKKRWPGEKICCIGYQAAEEECFFPETNMVLNSFVNVDPVFLENIWRRFHGIPVLIAQTERLIIRESREEDFPFLYEMMNEPGNERYTAEMSGDRREEKNKFCAYIQYCYPYYGFGLWTVVEKASGNIAGRCGLMPALQNEDGLRVELGYLIGGKYRRRGYALEACRKIVEYAFEELDCTEVCAVIHKENIASQRTAEKLGFQKQKNCGTEDELELWTEKRSDFSGWRR